MNHAESSQDLHHTLTQQRQFLPGGAVECGSRAAGEVLLDALVVADLGGNWYGGGLGPWGHHGGLSWGGLRLPGRKEPGEAFV